MPIAPTNSSSAIGVGARARTLPGPRRWRLQMPREVDGAEDLEGQEDRQQEAEVADAVDDERLLARRGAPVLLEVEADQEVGAQPHALPADEQDEQVGAQDQGEHGEHEQVQVREVARVARGLSACM